MDAGQKKIALRAINYGLYVLTSHDADGITAASVNWLSQASFEPPLIMVGVKADSHSCEMIGRVGSFAVNVLADDQLDIGKAYFRSTTVEGDLANGYRFEGSPTLGHPLIVDLPYWFECNVTDTVVRGDHTIFVGETVDAGVRREGARPMLLRDIGMNYGG